MAKEEKLNINEEFDKLLPPTERESLFDPSEDYESLRQYIIAQPRIGASKSKLPFSEVVLTSYAEYTHENIREEEMTKYHIFFLQQSSKGKSDFCDAAGYYVRQAKTFVLLPYSYIVNEPQGFVPLGYTRKWEKDENNLYTSQTLIFQSPEEAASYVLGQTAGLDEWIDSRGKGLLHYYKTLEPKPIVEATPLPVKKAPKKEDKPKLAEKDIHIVEIKVKDVCDAKGYFDPIDGYFYILKGSKIALSVSHEFSQTPVGKARERLIISNCTVEGGFFVVKKDSKCRTATAAASYVMGKNVTYIEWVTPDGKALKDFFPKRFYRRKTEENSEVLPAKEVKTKKVNWANHTFYIKREGEPEYACLAKGKYDPITNKFILLEGSLWSADVTSAFQYTAMDILRRNAIKKCCKLIFWDCKQHKDYLCDSPDQAASFVLGQDANGWDEWKDKDGQTLKDVLKGSTKVGDKKKGLINETIDMLLSQ